MADGDTEQDHCWLMQTAFQPVHEGRGTPYPCNQDAINRIDPLHYTMIPNNGPFTTSSIAAQEVEEWNRKPDLSKDESSALTRLHSAIQNIRLGYEWMPDLFTKMFADIDLVFFGGRLSGNVYLTWASAEMMERHSPGSAEMYGVTFRLPESQCQAWIWLNASAIFGSEREKHFVRVWACLLHEMCHAHEIVRVKPSNASAESHGPEFQRALNAVYGRAFAMLGVSRL